MRTLPHCGIYGPTFFFGAVSSHFSQTDRLADLKCRLAVAGCERTARIDAMSPEAFEAIPPK